MKVNIRNINILPRFAMNLPNHKKVNLAVDYYKKYEEFDKPIIVDNYQDLFLIDGFIRYLAALKLGLTYIDVFTIQDSMGNSTPTKLKPTLYIKGVFEKGGKKYTWKVPNNLYLKKGDIVLVNTTNPETNEQTTAIVTVANIFYNFYGKYNHKSVLDIIKRG